MPSVPTEPTSKAGIISTTTGERHIPASKRPDGSTRKEIKIRPGYKPPEDVEVYKNRTAEAFKTRGSTGVPGAATIEDTPTPTESHPNSNKNAKRREARKKAKSAEEQRGDATHPQGNDATSTVADELRMSNGNDVGHQEPSAGSTNTAATPVDPEADREKEAKKLQKKLRQARELAPGAV
jgi:partner of Y14 and mago protein